MKQKIKKFDPNVKCLYCNDVLGIQCKCHTPAIDAKGVVARQKADAFVEHIKKGGSIRKRSVWIEK